MQKKRGVFVLTMVSIMLVVMAGVVFVIGESVPSDDPQPGVASDTQALVSTDETLPILGAFPQMRGTGLDFGTVRIPEDLVAGPKLIVVSYDDNQQGIVNEWFEPLLELNTEFPTLNGYYTPLLPKDTADSAAFIVGGFAALANEAERERTVVVFTDVERFNELVSINSQDTVQLFLLDCDNQIRWQASGPVNKQKLDSLRTTLVTLTATSAMGQ
jgi:hypothetical protein